VSYNGNKVNILFRAAYIAAAFFMIHPGNFSDIIGVGVIAALILFSMIIPKHKYIPSQKELVTANAVFEVDQEKLKSIDTDSDA
jgi:UPF0716 family protein affecting phage T7 exclusion